MTHRKKVLQRRSKLNKRRLDLIVCTSAPRWRAAVRIAVRDSLERFSEVTIRLLEVEELARATQTVQTSPGAVLALEVGEENSHAVERWLKNARPEGVPVVGLLSMSNPQPDIVSNQERLQRTAILAALIREAGAVWTLDSPLEISDLLRIVLRQGYRESHPFSDLQGLAVEIWHSLPWQSTRPPLRLIREV